MTRFYIFIPFYLISLFGFSQGYEFALVHDDGYNFSVIATPDFDATDTDISDIGFTLMLPAGNYDVTNLSQFNGRTWSANEVTAATLTSLTLGDGTRDAFAMNLPPGQTILSHTSGTSFILISFEISNMPTTGLIEILDNSDPIATAPVISGALDSFYESNINTMGSTTQNYFSSITAGQGGFNFELLGLSEVDIAEFELIIYPNPASSFISINSDLDIKTVQMFDILGQLVLETSHTDRIKIKHLNAGIYILKVHTTKGSLTKKIIVE